MFVSVRIRPMDKIQTDQDRFSGKLLAAIGTTSGTIQFVDLLTGKLEKELHVHNYAVKFLEWAGCDLIISAAYSTSVSTTGLVHNDIYLTNVLTGTKKRLRPETDESPIQVLRVSFYHRYLAIAFRNNPLEIWDINSMRLLRRMSRTCPLIIDMAWSCKHHSVVSTESNDSQIVKESLVVLDSENFLHHVIVKGLHVKDGKPVNTEWRTGTAPIRCIAWKDDLLAFGDVNGCLRVWDVPRKTLRQIQCHNFYGPVQRLAFSRLIGDSTIAVQYSRGVVLYDALCLKQSNNILCSESTLFDMDMFGGTPVCISTDNIVRFP